MQADLVKMLNGELAFIDKQYRFGRMRPSHFSDFRYLLSLHQTCAEKLPCFVRCRRRVKHEVSAWRVSADCLQRQLRRGAGRLIKALDFGA